MWSALVLVLAACLASSCAAIPDSVTGTVKNTVRDGTQMWKDLVEPSPELELDLTAFGEAEERKLAALLKPVDEQVYQLTVYMDGENKLPPESWFRRLFERFSWISGVMVLDKNGNVQFQHPMDFSKPVDTAALIALGDPSEEDVEKAAERAEELAEEREDALEDAGENATLPEVPDVSAKPWKDHALRAMSGDSPLGPEVYLAQPLFRDNEFEGLVVVHFDPRNLLKFCPTPDELMIMTQEHVIWTSKYHDAASTMATLPWQEILAREVFGNVRVHDRYYYWLGRNVGKFSLIYATAVPGEDDYQPAAPPASPQAAPASSTP